MPGDAPKRELKRAGDFRAFLARAEVSISAARLSGKEKVIKAGGFTVRGESYLYRTATMPIWQRRIYAADLDYWCIFNCSVFEMSGRRYLAFRGNWNPATIGIGELNADWQLKNGYKKIEFPLVPENSSKGGWQEDPRAWWHCPRDGRPELWLSYAGVQNTEPWRASVCLARLDSEFNVIEQVIPRYEKRTCTEKNWAWFSNGIDKFCVYMTEPEHTILRLSPSGDMEEVARTAWQPSWWAGHLRGGAAPVLHEVPGGDGRREWYSFIHGTLVPEVGERYYTAALYTFEEHFPYRPSRWIPCPILAPNMANRPIRNDPAIAVFPCGALFDGQRNEWVVSYGYFDTSAWLAGWRADEIEQALTPVS